MGNDGIQTNVDPDSAFKRAASGTALPSTSPGLAQANARVGYDLITDASGNKYIIALDHQSNTVSVYKGDDKGGFTKVEVQDHGWERMGDTPAHQILLADGTQINTGRAGVNATINNKPAEVGTRATLAGGVPVGIVITPIIADQILSGADKIEPLYIKQAVNFDFGVKTLG